MAEFFHGVRTRQTKTSISTPNTASSGITFVVGTAPVHTVGGSVNEVIFGGNYNEAVSALGYSDDWKKYSLCEVMYNHYKLYTTAPIIFVNVLDPAVHKKITTSKAFQVIDNRVILPFEAIKDSVTVQTYAAGKDYDLFYDTNALVLEILEGGTIPAGTSTLTIGFNEVDPSMVTKTDIIGGFNVTTKKTTGLELIESVFPAFSIVTDIVIVPGWSHDAEVAAVMSAKATKINGIFEAKALIDVDTSTVKHYADAPAWKKSKNINAKTQILCFPMVKLGDRQFHMSTQAAGLTATVDARNGGAPSESPSNKLLQINSAVLADGTEVLLDLQQANYLNSNGIVTALNFVDGFVLWGNETACFPANTDVKDYFIPVSRMFAWVANSVILTYWNQVDRKLSRRFVDSIVDGLNIWLNGLTTQEHLLGGHVEFREEDNSLTDLMSGRAVFHIFMTPPSPAREIEFILEYDPSYVAAALT